MPVMLSPDKLWSCWCHPKTVQALWMLCWFFKKNKTHLPRDAELHIEGFGLEKQNFRPLNTCSEKLRLRSTQAGESQDIPQATATVHPYPRAASNGSEKTGIGKTSCILPRGHCSGCQMSSTVWLHFYNILRLTKIIKREETRCAGIWSAGQGGGWDGRGQAWRLNTSALSWGSGDGSETHALTHTVCRVYSLVFIWNYNCRRCEQWQKLLKSAYYLHLSKNLRGLQYKKWKRKSACKSCPV